MELKQLEWFISIAESGAFSRAAMRLSLSQPILSRQIKALEDELGVELFHRTGRGVTLTPAGVMLEQYARGLIETARGAVIAVKAAGGATAGPVVIGMPSSIASVLSVSLVREFRHAFPTIPLKVLEGYSGNVLEWLSAGRTDIAVLYDPSRLRIPALRTDALLTDELFLLGPMSDPAGVGKGPVPARRLARIPLILPSRPHGVRMLVDEALASVGAEPNVEMEIDAMHSMMQLVESGLGYAVLSYSCAAELIAHKRVRIWRVIEPTITRSLVIASSTQRPSSKPVRKLATMLRRQIQDLVDRGRWIPAPDIFS